MRQTRLAMAMRKAQEQADRRTEAVRVAERLSALREQAAMAADAYETGKEPGMGLFQPILDLFAQDNGDEFGYDDTKGCFLLEPPEETGLLGGIGLDCDGQILDIQVDGSGNVSVRPIEDLPAFLAGLFWLGDLGRVLGQLEAFSAKVCRVLQDCMDQAAGPVLDHGSDTERTDAGHPENPEALIEEPAMNVGAPVGQEFISMEELPENVEQEDVQEELAPDEDTAVDEDPEGFSEGEEELDVPDPQEEGVVEESAENVDNPVDNVDNFAGEPEDGDEISFLDGEGFGDDAFVEDDYGDLSRQGHAARPEPDSSFHGDAWLELAEKDAEDAKKIPVLTGIPTPPPRMTKGPLVCITGMQKRGDAVAIHVPDECIDRKSLVGAGVNIWVSGDLDQEVSSMYYIVMPKDVLRDRAGGATVLLYMGRTYTMYDIASGKGFGIDGGAILDTYNSLLEHYRSKGLVPSEA